MVCGRDHLPRPIMFWRGLIICSLFSIWGCDRSPEPSDRGRDLQLVPPADVQEQNAPQGVFIPTPERCVPVWPALVRLAGVLEEGYRLGPPGYGETPDRDQRLTIYLLRLVPPIDICASATTDDPHHAVAGIELLQLTGRVDPEDLKQHIGEQLNVYGWLYHRVRGTDFTEVLLRVDSIPAIRKPPPAHVGISLHQPAVPVVL